MTRKEFINNYQRNYNALMNFANSLTKDTVKSEDLVQETIIKAFKSKHTFKNGSNFKSWAFTILKNCFISRYRKMKRRGEITGDISQYTFGLQSENPIHNDGVMRLSMQEINKSIDELSHKVKVPFRLFVEGYQYNEIADMLNIPIGTVKSRINFTRKKLQKRLKMKVIAA